MLSRRAFVGAGAALAAFVTFPLRALKPSYGAHDAFPLRVIFDCTFHAGLAFGVAAERSGAHVAAVGADLGSYWMSTLEPLLKRGPLTLAGLTAGAPLFCLEVLCRNYGLRTVYRIEHLPAADGHARHTLTGDPVLAAWTDRLAAAGADWPGAAATVATEAFGRWQLAPAIELLDLRAHERGTRSLFSWMIAPARVGAALAATLRDRG
jgi:hypothetical protein